MKHLNSNRGFTLLEVLVTTGIIAILFVVASAVFVNTIRSANKANITNEARQNASLVLESLENDVRKATSASVVGSNLTLSYRDGSTVAWDCVAGAVGENDYLTREGLTITNRDPANGISAENCAFEVSGVGENYIVTIALSLAQGNNSGAAQELQVLVSHRTSFTTRGY